MMRTGDGQRRGRRHSLQRFVHRTLLLRLAAATLAMSVAGGAACLLLERDRVSDEAMTYAVGRWDRFLSQYGSLLADPAHVDVDAFHVAFQAFRQTRDRISLGEIVALRLWSPGDRLLLQMYADEYDLAGAVRAGWAVEPPPRQAEAAVTCTVLRIGGRPHLRIVVARRPPQEDVPVVADGLFAFSAETIGAFRSRASRSALGIVLAVLLTTAILYPVILRLTRRVVDFSVRLLEANLETLETLGNAIARRDDDTNTHNLRVTILCARIGEEVGLPPATMRALIKGAFLHDVGKIGIPDRILHKPGRLDPEEFDVMKTHVEQGHEIVSRSSWLQDALRVVLFHHEKVGGDGYPNGVAGEEIPVTARIFAIADVFDALTSKRPYKDPLTFEQAMETLQEGRGIHFDAALLDVFTRIARPLYERLGGKDEVSREELAEIVRIWFQERMDSLEY